MDKISTYNKGVTFSRCHCICIQCNSSHTGAGSKNKGTNIQRNYLGSQPVSNCKTNCLENIAGTAAGTSRVLARIFEMPVQNSNSNISAFPDLATQLHIIPTPTKLNSKLC